MAGSSEREGKANMGAASPQEEKCGAKARLEAFSTGKDHGPCINRRPRPRVSTRRGNNAVLKWTRGERPEN